MTGFDTEASTALRDRIADKGEPISATETTALARNDAAGIAKKVAEAAPTQRAAASAAYGLREGEAGLASGHADAEVPICVIEHHSKETVPQSINHKILTDPSLRRRAARRLPKEEAGQEFEARLSHFEPRPRCVGRGVF